MRYADVFLLLYLTSFIVGCAAQSGVRNVPPPSVPPAGLEAPETPPEYRLGYGDVIEVKFFNNERFNETVTVRPDGRITLEKVGEILVAGTTPSRLDSLITVKYAGILNDPDVTVFVRSFGVHQVYILGEVNAPGGYPIEREMTILQSIAVAGGTRPGAKLKSVVVLRPGAGETGQGFLIDLKQHLASHGKPGTQSDLFVRPRDIVYIPKTGFATFNDFMVALWDGTLRPVELLINAAAFQVLR